MLEATYLVMNRFVWVHTVAIGGQTRVSCIVAFTRNSDRVATITKVGSVFMNSRCYFLTDPLRFYIQVYTHPQFRGRGIAEKLVRQVCMQ